VERPAVGSWNDYLPIAAHLVNGTLLKP
jgi:hypothetical protein